MLSWTQVWPAVRLIVAIAGWASAPSKSRAAGGTPHRWPDVPVVFSHVGVVDVERGTVRRDQTVVTLGDRVVDVGASASVHVPAGAVVVDAADQYLMPGLWDAHVHLSYLGACALPVFVAYGVTSVRDAGARMEDVVAWRTAIADGRLVGPRIWTAGPDLESGEWLDMAEHVLPPSDSLWARGPRLRVGSPADADAAVDSLARLGVDFVKFRNLSGPSFRAVAAAARRHQLPLAGHAPHQTSLADAVRAGINSVEHAETVMLALDPATLAERRRAFDTMARAHVFLTPTLITYRVMHLTPDSQITALVDDSAGARAVDRRYVDASTVELWRTGVALKRFESPADWAALYARQVRDVRTARAAGVRLLAGTDLGGTAGLYAGRSLHEELQLLVHDVGLAPADALRAAVTDPPAFFGAQRTMGRIAAGQVADLVLVDRNPLADVANVSRIRAVMTRGRLLRRAALDSMLASVARHVATHTGCEPGP